MKTLAADDLEVGMFVTLLQGAMMAEKQEMNPMTGVVAKTPAREDCCWQGEVMQIRYVALPFVVVDIHKKYGSHVRKFDVRRGWQFGALHDDYVRALRPRLFENANQTI